ncbi:MAG TPA: TAT-variant-translocated molybdopterin oxidoreductase [Chitinophagaceae bacterium]|nr:TAT-variant-translocated molybdopterin oxidoreductase [Chitinophagaceae bacterium]
MNQKKYWRGLEELQDSPERKKNAEDEFREPLPFDEPQSLLETPTPRRDFLKYLGFSITAATVAAGCEIQVRKAIPYLVKPEEITPGVPNYYASTYCQDGDYCPILIKTIDGRPIKVEGNNLSSLTAGGTSARVQASVLSLYDTARIRYPMINGEETTWATLDKMVLQGLGDLGTGSIVILTSSIISPSIQQAISDFIVKYPQARQVTYDAVSYSGLLMANKECYGKQAIPAYHFDQARCIVGLDCDFLGTWLSPVEFARQYAVNRKIRQDNPRMSQHFQFESNMSLTGANADYRYVHKPSQSSAIALALYNAVANLKGKPTLAGEPLTDSRLTAGIQKTAKALGAQEGHALVVSGSNNPHVQVIVNGLNEMLGSGGRTLDWSSPLNYRQGIDQDMEQVLDDMAADRVGALLVYQVNPAYDYYRSDAFRVNMGRVKLSISFNERQDETTVLCKYAAPDSHYLESWGDSSPRQGYFSLQQPGIAPLFKTRQFLESLLVWSGAAQTDPLPYIQDYWKKNIYPHYNNIYPQLGNADWQTWWDQSLQNGVVEPKVTPAAVAAHFSGNMAGAAAGLSPAAAQGSLEIVFYENVAMGSGKWANNPWLQEMPDPITKCTWDNYVCISPALSDQIGATITRFNEVYHHRPVARLTIGGKDILLPVLVLPGLHPEVMAVALGYGRSNSTGMVAGDVGKNIFPFISYNAQNQAREYYSTGVKIVKTAETYPLGITQTHNSYEGRPIIRETTLHDFSLDPSALKREELAEESRYGKDYSADATLYPQIYESPGIRWGMSIDLNSCIGCSACTIACIAENNVSVVGKKEVVRAHEMQWLRIDRYFDGDPENPQVVFQPMLCQQCSNAPCENVCPVAATTHSDEGLNQMIYNRCIGTRYCENNCPYKVRRFNWRDWNGADSFADNLYLEDKANVMMNEDLTRMVLNPEVTVRSRGVMEKCTFCVQRLQDAKLVAKKAGRPLIDGEAVTACQQACPTQAIAFGNINDKASEVYRIRTQDQHFRSYYVLDLLHTLPSIDYLAKIRNKDPEDFFSEPPQHVL